MAFISEIHYQNVYANNSGVAEYVEIALTAAESARASDFDISAYQIGGSASQIVNLGTVTPVYDSSTGHYVYTVNMNITAPDHAGGGGEAEALALTDSSLASPVLSFYEIDVNGDTSAITAIDGPAAGEPAVSIPPSPSGSSI